MATIPDVLDANGAFYRAFAGRDLDAMDAVWASAAPVACVHPGWDALRGRDAVMQSWRAILSGPRSPEIGCSHAFAQVLGDTALVICREHVAGGQLVATNVFVREANGWKLVHHQASPLASEDDDDEPGQDEPLN
jgi:ketosteroid isomerase-like protein